jgi:choline dehydrogenase-like flavoprotein
MWLDARQLPQGQVLDCDVCIVGAGAAGITIARELAGSGLSVLLAEAGGADYDDASQAFYKGRSIGLGLDPETTRLRQLGGSTNHWGGRSRPFEADDFAERPWVPYSGWPIPYAEFAACLPRACETCEIACAEFKPPPGATLLPFDPALLPSDLWRFSPPTRFGERWGPELERAANLRLLLRASLVEIGLADGLQAVADLRFATAPGRGFHVRPRVTVLACGGLENARLLLASRRQVTTGIGNGHDMVGRFLAGHPIWEPLEIQLHAGEGLPPLYTQAIQGCSEGEGMVQLSRSLQAIRRTTAIDAAFYDGGQFGPPGVRAARRIVRALQHGHLPSQLATDLATVLGDLDSVVRAGLSRTGLAGGPGRTIAVSVLVEQAPNPDSRVTLGDEADAFGVPRLVIDWRVSESDRHTIRVLADVMAHEVGRTGLGRARIADWLADPGPGWPHHGNSAHHVGTTRMATRPEDGVVDGDCRVHGIDNLFVAGSSVFPTGGSVHPTLNLVALAIRLADHLKRLGPA